MTGTVRFAGRRLVFGVVLTCGLIFGAAAAALAGQGAEATIFGQVTDASGAVLPGVTVTVTSPALQVPQVVAVTDERGDYRITPLPLGTYAVEYTLPGFQTLQRDGIRLTAGFVARLDVSLAVGGVAETITVSGASPVVDVKTTSAGTLVQREVLETVPTNRNSFTSLLTLAAGARPQMDDGGSALSSDAVFRAFGRAGESWPTVDGLPIGPPNNDGNTGFQTSMDYGAIDEARVQTLGTNAEAPTSGIQLHVITKSGSNEFHGGGFLGQTFDWLETKSNVDDQLRAQGITKSAEYYVRWDRSGDIGGRVIRDKLWFWGGARRRDEEQEIIGAFFPDGRNSTFQHSQRYWSGKGTYQITQSQQLIGSIHGRMHNRFNGPSSRFAAPDQVRGTRFNTWPQAQATWQMVQGNRVLSVQGGLHNIHKPFFPLYTDNAAWRDDVTGFQGGTEPRAGWRFDMERWTGQATLNWYKPDWSGNHDFKIGSMYTIGFRQNLLEDKGLPPGNYELRYRDGVPHEVRAKNSPIDPKSYLGYLGLYVQDSWAVNRRLTLNLGIRYANDRGWLPPQCRVDAPREFAVVFPAECWERRDLKSWNPVAPRMHAAYDLTGDGRTVVKGGWGRFYLMHDQVELDILNPNAEKVARFRWRDLNNNRYFDAGESNLDLNGPDFQGISGPGEAYAIDAPGVATSVPLTNLRDNPDLKEQGSDEFSLSVERELLANFGVRVTGLYVREFNVQRIMNPLRPYEVYNIPITNPHPGPDGIRGNADDPGTTVTYYDYPASLRGTAFQAAMFINDPGAEATYRSFEVALNKRLSNRWQMLASYSGTKLNVPVPRNSEFTPNAEINSADKTYEWLFRTSGSYQFPGDVQVSSNLLVQSGFQYAATLSATGGTQIRSFVLYTEPRDTRTTEALTVMSLGVEKGFRFRPGHRMAVGLKFLNLLNGNGIPTLPQTRVGSRFGYATRIQTPRLGELTLRYTF